MGQGGGGGGSGGRNSLGVRERAVKGVRSAVGFPEKFSTVHGDLEFACI